MKNFALAMFVCLLMIGAMLCNKSIADDSSQGIVTAALNGLEITLDGHTGSILSLDYPGPGKILQAEPSQASIIDMAYPVEEFEILRLASRFSSNATIEKTADTLTIQWKRLGASRELFQQPGDVSAEVTLKASDDGKSIIMEATIKNDSDVAVRQVFFPDFLGLLPFAGKNLTMFNVAGATRQPFVELAAREECRFYAVDGRCTELQSGGLFAEMILRWADLGSLGGGMSLFPKRWGWDERASTMLHLSRKTDKLRWMCTHNVDIKKSQEWHSREYVLTPHGAGWAKGMEPYRQWVKENCNRRYPLPKHVREGLGFRSVWMCQYQPNDPQDAVWKFSDLPKIAKETKEHGIDEIVLWGWHDGFALPFDATPFPHLGTKQDVTEAIGQCRELGVNVVPFISVLQAKKKTAHKYGLTVPDTGGWTYHTEAYPLFQPLYAHGMRCAQVDTNNELWKKEVLQSIGALKESGATSVSWDQYWTKPGQDLVELTERILDLLKKDDPEATFSGEELWNWEIDSELLDYTWNWTLKDYVILNSAFPAPRANYNIEHSPAEVKKCFADNVYMNIFPSKPGGMNGSAYIAEYPEFSKALKQCAKLRKQFLQYFTEGTLIGDCVLTQPCQQAHVSAYVLPDSALMILTNRAAERKVGFSCDLEPWLKSASGKYAVKAYDTDGELVESLDVDGPVWEGSTHSMNHLDMALFEFVAK